MATDKPMQLGMVGLGRMGAGIVRRLMRDGHRCVGYDVNSEAVAALAADGAVGASTVAELRGGTRASPRGLGNGARRRDHRLHDRATGRGDGARGHDHRRRQHPLPRRHPSRRRIEGQGHPPRRLRHQRRRLGIGARVLPDDRRRDRGRTAPEPAVRHDRPRGGRRPANTRPQRRSEPLRAGLPALRPERRRALREDGPQRDRVRDDGRLRRGPVRSSTPPTRACTPRSRTPRRPRWRTRGTTSTRSTRPRSPRSGAGAAWSGRGCWT